MDALEEGYRDGILEQRPTLVNLQCDVDHPTQCMADMLHVIHYFGGVENLKGKKVAMTWAYSPSYGKPLSVPQGVIGLFTRFGMDVTLAHPEGYDVMPEVEEIARKNCEQLPAPSFHKTQRHGGSLPGRRHRLSQVLGAVQGHGGAHQALCRRATRPASTRWRRSCWRRTPSTRTGPAPKR